MWKVKKKYFFGKLADTICVRQGKYKRAFSLQLSVLAKFFLDQNSLKQETL